MNCVQLCETLQLLANRSKFSVQLRLFSKKGRGYTQSNLKLLLSFGTTKIYVYVFRNKNIEMITGLILFVRLFHLVDIFYEIKNY